MTPALEEIESFILATLRDMTADWDLELETLDRDSRLSADFCFSSVDMLDLMASIDMKYRRKLRYDQLLIKDGKYVSELTVGQLADFVHAHFDDLPDATPQAM